jgi:four helix bundle protein
VLHQNTRIYQKTLELNRLAKNVIAELPRGMAFLADQLRRAAASVALNYAEGYGKTSLNEQRRFFSIAKGSAYEVAAILDIAREWDAISPEHYATGQDLADHVAAMLTRFRAA